MRAIPKKMREEMADDPFMAVCIYNNNECSSRVEWEHAFTYARKQVNEKWAIVPCCTYHHRGAGLSKDYNRYRALLRATDEDLAKYSKSDFKQLKKYLIKKYEESKEIVEDEDLNLPCSEDCD